MFRLRLTAGRATAPLGQPPIAAARGIEIPLPDIVLFAEPVEITLQADSPHGLVYSAPPTPPSQRLDAAVLEPLATASLDPRLLPSDDGELFFQHLDLPTIGGGRILLPVPQRLGSAPSLPRASGSRRDVAWRAHAFLEPGPSLNAESVYLGFPRALRPYQIEAVHQLHSHEGFLLADDPGTGKTVTACAALQVLFQSRQVRRTLIICLEGGARHWATHLSTWAPGLAVTAVHGDWQSPADVFLVDYDSLAADLDAGRLTPETATFDLIVLDDVHALQRRAGQPQPMLDRLTAKRRWALAGALPREAGEWLTIFGFLTPDRGLRASEITLPNLTRRFLPDTLRRTKAELVDQLPRLTRDELWVDLDPRQSDAYEAILLEERERLSALGAAASRSHLEAALHRLHRACNFAPGSLDGCKVRPLVNVVEDIVSAGAKVVVFTQFHGRELEDLRRVLEAYGAVVADSEGSEEEQSQALQRFRTEAGLHVLLADDHLRPSGGPLVEASYIIHFDHSWNPAVRRRAETRLHPDPGPVVAVNVIEFWVADTIDERLHELLAERSLLPADLPHDVRAPLLEDRLTPADLMQRVLQVPPMASPPALVQAPEMLAAVTATEEPPVAPAPPAEKQPAVTSRPLEVIPTVIESPAEEPLPSGMTTPAPTEPAPPVAIEKPAPKTAEGLLAAVMRLIKNLGFEEAEVVRGPAVAGGDVVVRRRSGTEEERVLVRCIPSTKDVGVGEGRELLTALNSRPALAAAYLATTADFTPACRRLALETGGRLRLISGAEIDRYLHLEGEA